MEEVHAEGGGGLGTGLAVALGCGCVLLLVVLVGAIVFVLPARVTTVKSSPTLAPVPEELFVDPRDGSYVTDVLREDDGSVEVVETALAPDGSSSGVALHLHLAPDGTVEEQSGLYRDGERERGLTPEEIERLRPGQR